MGNECSSRWPQSQNTLPCRSTSRGVASGDELAAAGDGAGDDKPAEPCTKRHKTHIQPVVKEWFCSLAGVKRDWTMAQCLLVAKKRVLPPFVEHVHMDTPRKWFSQKTSGSALGRPRSLEPAAVLTLALADIVSRVCSRVCCGAGILANSCTRTWRHLAFSTASPLASRENSCDHLGTPSRNPRASCSRIINIDETCCKMLHQLQRESPTHKKHTITFKDQRSRQHRTLAPSPTGHQRLLLCRGGHRRTSPIPRECPSRRCTTHPRAPQETSYLGSLSKSSTSHFTAQKLFHVAKGNHRQRKDKSCNRNDFLFRERSTTHSVQHWIKNCS